MELKPNKITDIVAAMALFRPATMDSGATKTYIKRRHKKEEVPEMHSIISKNTKATYGIMLFQEQVISILRDLGMDADNLTSFLKAVKASNSDVGDAGGVISGYKTHVQEMSIEKGMNDNDFAWLWEAIEGFAAYGFNQAHSVAYGLTAYRCAYLAQNHPTEFFAAVLSVAAGTDKEETYIAAARKSGVRILSSDVNSSGVTYAVDKKRKAIRKGLLSIKGVGEKAAQEIIDSRPSGGWKNKDEFTSMVSHRKVTGIKALKEGDATVGTIGKLHEAGALESLYEAV
jgi:DNA polymerase-3 subunit alpha